MLSILILNIVLQVALKDDFPRWQKKKEMDICLGDCELDCLRKLRFADEVLLFPTTEEQFQKMMCDFKHSTEKVKLEIHPGKNEDSQQPKIEQKERNGDR